MTSTPSEYDPAILQSPYVPPLSGGTRPRGANLPLRTAGPGGIVAAQAETPMEAPPPAPLTSSEPVPYSQAPVISLELPQLPDWGCSPVGSVGNLLGICSEPPIPGDVEDPTWMQFEFLIWRFKDATLPPIVTTSSPASLGVLGQPDTRVLFGEEATLPEKFGFRIAFGSWFEPTETFGLEASYMVLMNQARVFEQRAYQGAVLARPFFNVNTWTQDSAPFSNPIGPAFGPTDGGIIGSIAGRFQNVEVNVLSNHCRGHRSRIDWIYGLRYLSLMESIDIKEALVVPVDGVGLGGTGFFFHDQFDAKNYYLGGQVGLRAEKQYGCWRLGGTAKLGMGYMYERANIQGGTFLSSPTVFWQAFPGGFLALPSNIGRYRNDSFAFVPEIGVKLGYEIKDHVYATFGYNLIYISNVLRPGEMIDTRINPEQLGPPAVPLTGPTFPEPRLRETGFIAHGVTFGLEIRY
ncbi:MAG TPA: BBP7 family outer membrane beta-barrel protein [Gemmatales bacterium]|nr:BBP7 family outer membrane beta-barrel protein [Gemmatales bacterium]HMP58113.1 BBP7 family outer membrane beta-barrel protein [Gemmatales bacterium]